MNDVPPPPIRQLGRYTITRELRRERASVVYLAVDPVLHREVVLKAVQFPPPTDATEKSDAQLDPLEQAFVRQAQAAGRLSHPHIVTVYEATRVRDVGFIAIERVNGRPLHELIARGWRPEFVHCASVAARVADAIAYAHAQGVAHGHLGPQHVLLQADGAPKVEGFGGWIDTGAAGEDVLRQTHQLLPYFENEIDGEAVRRDVRAIASLVYMMLSGRAPDGRTSVLVRRPDTPPVLAQLVDELLAEKNDKGNGSQRTAGELRDTLTAYIWNARKEDVAPATIGIPLAAPPKAPPPAELPAAPLHVPSPAPAPRAPTLRRTLTPLTKPPTNPDEARAEAPATVADTVAATARTARSAADALLPWLERNRFAVLAAGGFVVVGVVIAMLLATFAGRDRAADAARAAQQAAAPVTGEGVVQFDIAPWGEIVVNSKPMGVAPPLTELKLAAGRYTVEVRHGDKAAVVAQVDVSPGKPLLIRHRFQ